MFVAGDKLFFTALFYDEATEQGLGRELWVSDGTPTGTHLVKDIFPDDRASTPTLFTAFNDALYFIAEDGTLSPKLWKSDGSTDGTIWLKEFPGQTFLNHVRVKQLARFKNELYFATTTGLWKTDGSPAGTVQITEALPNIASFTEYNDELFFAAATSKAGYELWKTDGTKAGTGLVKDIFSGTENVWPSNMTVFQNVLYFTARGQSGSPRLWKTDGSEAGTQPIGGNTTGLTIANIEVFGEGLLISGDDRYHGLELWISDGTGGGTTLLKDIRLAGGVELVSVGSKAFFVRSNETRQYELWVSDGTSSGTHLLREFSREPEYLTQFKGALYFSAYDDIHGQELWRSNGQAAGTEMIRDIIPGVRSSIRSNFTVVGDHLFFAASDGIHGIELWKSDGSSEGTVLVKDIVAGASPGMPAFLTGVDDVLYFRATDNASGFNLWRSDGSPEGTIMVKDLVPGPGGHVTGGLTAVDDHLYFLADEGDQKPQLWRSDGTEAGTTRVTEQVWFKPPYHLTAVGRFLFFAANDGLHGAELWRSDGTAEGTWMVADLRYGGGGWNDSSLPELLTPVNDTLFFVAEQLDIGVDPWFEVGVELFISQGMKAEVQLVKDINPSKQGYCINCDFSEIWLTAPHHLTADDDILYFTALDGIHGRELWRSDGTADGTFLIQDLFTGPPSSNPMGLTPVSGKLFFFADTGSPNLTLNALNPCASPLGLRTP